MALACRVMMNFRSPSVLEVVIRAEKVSPMEDIGKDENGG